jgi:hypothetical protein
VIELCGVPKRAGWLGFKILKSQNITGPQSGRIFICVAGHDNDGNTITINSNPLLICATLNSQKPTADLGRLQHNRSTNADEDENRQKKAKPVTVTQIEM